MRRRRKDRFGEAAVLAALLLCGEASWAQCLLKGRVLAGETGKGLSGAKVTLTLVSTGEANTSTTDSDGRYQFVGTRCVAGYLVVASLPGFETIRISNVIPGLAGPPLNIRMTSPAKASSMASPMPTPPEESHAVVKVFYATDREPTGSTTPAGFYGRKQSERLSYGVCQVRIPMDTVVASWRAPRSGIPSSSRIRTKHAVLLSVAPEGQDAFFGKLQTAAAPARTALVFVHGYNVTFEEAARRMGQLAYDLKIDAPVLYSWPSSGVLLVSPSSRSLGYTADATNAQVTVPRLEEFLREVAERSGASEIHLVAHSMGNLAMTQALDRIAARPGPSFSQVVLAAPDIDARVFVEQFVTGVTQVSRHVTLYASSKDEALRASKAVNGGRRAGDSGDDVTVVPGIDTVDVSAVDTRLGIHHSYYGDNDSVVSDLFYVLRGKSPDERARLKKEFKGTLPYWVFQ